MSYRARIRQKCLDCVGGDYYSEIDRCSARTPTKPCDPSGCYLWPYRSGHGTDRIRQAKPPSPLRSIRLECLNCMGGSGQAVAECETDNCALYGYRFGKDPNKPTTRPNGAGAETLRRARLAAAARRKTLGDATGGKEGRGT